MSYYWVGDKPLEALVFVPSRAGEILDLAAWDAATAQLINPNGIGAEVAATSHEDDGTLEVAWPSTPLTVPGLYRVRVTLHKTTGGYLQRLDDVLIVVHADDGWHTLPSARSEWPDAPAGDAQLWSLLEVARGEVLAYAPVLGSTAVPPVAYRMAQLMQARNTWNAQRVDPASGGTGTDAFSLTPFPLDWQIKQLLRPKSARPVAL